MRINKATFSEIDALFDQALELPSEDRARFVASLDLEHKAKQRLERLLQSVESDVFLGEAGTLAADLEAVMVSAVNQESASAVLLEAGQRIGPYMIRDLLGSGGMGHVYRAFDATLDREVALKACADLTGALGSDRRSRFEREARLLASLNHPNIAAIYGLEEFGGQTYLVLELVEGESLNELLEGGPIQLGRAADYALQIAQGVEEAHRKGVVHRDLKPANLKLTHDGRVKILDFGLAKLDESASMAPASPGFETSAAPLVGDAHPTPGMAPTPGRTQTGWILGTAAYMSPEQARGHAVDRRTDVWSFGCVFYEMLTGERPFRGETSSDLLAAVLREEPDFTKLPERTPGAIRRVLRRCLRKPASERYQDIGDVRVELEEWLAGLAEDPLASHDHQPLSIGSLAPWIIALLALAVAVFAWRGADRAVPDGEPIRLTLDPGPGLSFANHHATVALPAPDGRAVLYSATSNPDGRSVDSTARNLYWRELDDLEAVAIEGTEAAYGPFFNEDGTRIAFIADRKLRFISVTRSEEGHVAFSPVEVIAEVGGNIRGGAWFKDTVYTSLSQTSPLVAIDIKRGERTAFTELDLEAGERSHRWPFVLDSGRAVIFTSQFEGTDFDQARIMVQPLDGGPAKVLLEGGAHAKSGAQPRALVCAQRPALGGAV